MNSIFLCGFMGAGKSKIGEVLSGLLDYDFVDLDGEIERRAGCSISQLFKQEGEREFRKREREAVNDFLKAERCVVALGGGALQDEPLTNQIKKKALLVFVGCPILVIIKRLEADKSRPLLLNEDGSKKEASQLEKELTELYENRLPLYWQAAITVDSSTFSSPHEAAVYLKNKIEQYGY